MLYIKDHYYHVYNRGVAGNNVFYEHEDYLHLLKLVKKYQKRYAIKVVAYSLIPNHYHFLIRQESEVPASRFLQTLFNSYVQGLNAKMGRKGTLFEGSAKSRFINKEDYLIYVCIYIHLNPIKHGIVNNLLDWEYSNYFEFIGVRNGSIFDKEFMLNNFGDSKTYKKWVEDSLANKDYYNNVEKYIHNLRIP